MPQSDGKLRRHRQGRMTGKPVRRRPRRSRRGPAMDDRHQHADDEAEKRNNERDDREPEADGQGNPRASAGRLLPLSRLSWLWHRDRGRGRWSSRDRNADMFGIVARVPHCLQRDRRPARLSATSKSLPQPAQLNAIIVRAPEHPPLHLRPQVHLNGDGPCRHD